MKKKKLEKKLTSTRKKLIKARTKVGELQSQLVQASELSLSSEPARSKSASVAKSSPKKSAPRRAKPASAESPASKRPAREK